MLNNSWGVVAAHPTSIRHGVSKNASSGWASVAEGPVQVLQSTPVVHGVGIDSASEALDESIVAERADAGSLVDDPGGEPVANIGGGAPTKRRRGRPKKQLLAGISCSAGIAGDSQREGDGHIVHASTSDDALFANICTAGGLQQLSLEVVPSMLSPIVVDGLTFCSPCCPALAACVSHCKQKDALIDQEYLALHEHFIENPDYHVSSLEVLSEKLCMNRRSVQGKMCRLASAQVMMLKYHRWHFERTLASELRGLSGLKVYVDASCYDETPMRATVRTSSSSEFATGRGALAHDAEVEKGMHGLDFALSVKSQSCKILQVRQTFGMLVEVNNGLVKFIGRSVLPLSVMQRTSAEVLLQCFLLHGGPSPLCKQFGLCSRVTCSDKAAYNLRCERQMASMRGGWPHLATTCEIHATATTYGKTLDGLVPSHVSSMIHAALSLQGASALQLFRECLRAEVRQRLVILHGSPTIEASEHRRSCLELFQSSGTPHAMLSSLLLHRLPNGDWRHPEQVQHFMAEEDAGLSCAELADQMESGLCWVLARSQPHTYERHRWTGADLAVDHLSRLECVNKLFTHSYRRFALLYSKPSGHSSLGRLEGRDTDEQGCLRSENLTVAGPVVLEAPDGSAQASDGQVHLSDLSSGVHDVSFAESNSRDRKMTLSWLSKRPWTHLVLMKMAIAPLSQYMHAQLHLSSEEFELIQRSKVAGSLLGNAPTFAGRDFMITIAAENRLELTYFSEVKKRFNAKHLWNLVDAEDMHVSCRHMAFKLLSRQASLIYELIASTHTQYPCRLFRALADATAVEHLQASPSCMLDQWSLQVRQRYTGQEAEFREMLYLHALQVSTSIAHIESRHSAVRRILQSRVHTHHMELSCCSAEFVFQQLRRMKSSKLMGLPSPRKPALGKDTHVHDTYHNCFLGLLLLACLPSVFMVGDVVHLNSVFLLTDHCLYCSSSKDVPGR
eukprot:6492769-Amphidinium_carterae.7